MQSATLLVIPPIQQAAFPKQSKEASVQQASDFKPNIQDFCQDQLGLQVSFH